MMLNGVLRANIHPVSVEVHKTWAQDLGIHVVHINKHVDGFPRSPESSGIHSSSTDLAPKNENTPQQSIGSFTTTS